MQPAKQPHLERLPLRSGGDVPLGSEQEISSMTQQGTQLRNRQETPLTLEQRQETPSTSQQTNPTRYRWGLSSPCLRWSPYQYARQHTPPPTGTNYRSVSYSVFGRSPPRDCPFQVHKLTREDRAQNLGRYPGYRGCTVWFTGLSGAGKTTVAFALEKILNQTGLPTYGLDGDNVRNGLCKNLNFSKDDRCENIRRVAEVAKLFADMGIITLASFISPYRRDREDARAIHEREGIKFFEIYVNTSLEECERRDPKNLYKKARAGQIKQFTGVSSEYEAPENADLELDTENRNERACVDAVVEFLHQQGIIPPELVQSHDNKSSVRELQVTKEEAEELMNRAANMPQVEITEIDRQWLQVLAEGWATPLSGFMRERQYLQCLHHGQLLDLKPKCTEPGSSAIDILEDPTVYLPAPVNQSVPIVLPINDAQKSLIMPGEEESLCKEVALTYNGSVIAVLCDPEVYKHRKEERIARQFGFMDRRHPGIELVMSSGNWLLGGDLKVLDRIRYNDGLDDYRLTPLELRNRFHNCDAVFAFQLRNPIHNGHALLMNDTRRHLLQQGYQNPMLLLHPLGGWVKDDDVPLSVRMDQHKAILDEGVLNSEWTVLSIFPSPMLYAGPTEVQWHARARLAAGVTTYIVGRDPAGIPHPDTKDYLYDPTHGSKVLTMAPGLSDLRIIPFRVAAYDRTKKEMSYFDATRKDDFVFISGTKMRQYAREGEDPPEGFMSPRAWQILSSYYRNKNGGGQ